MNSIVFYPHSSLSKPDVGKPRFSQKEFILHTSRSNKLIISVPSIRADGNRRGVAATRSTNTWISAVKNGREKPYDLSTLEEISALFRRVQTSIAKERSSTSLEKPSGKPTEEKSTNRKSDELLTTGWSGELQKTEKTFSPATSEIKPTRPPSNFVKRSPIAPLQIPKREDEVKSGPSSSDIATNERKSLEDMKLPQLKQLAKSRGIRGYSKLKKSELLELLMA